MGYKAGFNQPHVPPDATRVWKYMTLEKMLALLQSRSLWFSRLDTLGDPYEGYLTNHALKEFREWQRTSPLGYLRNGADLEESIGASLAAAHEEIQRIWFANCWHMQNDESMTMWRLYGGRGIAIESTVGSVRQALTKESFYELQFGEVTYLDEESDNLSFFDGMGIVFNKPPAYRYEQEFRIMLRPYLAVNDDGSGLPFGYPVGVDISVLMSRIHISPEQPSYAAIAIEETLRLFRCQCDIVYSNLLRRPRTSNEKHRPTG